MGFIIGLLTFILVLDCIVLIFLVLLQLPKKEAGAGLAFGGAATDALFGAGSGNVLTKITKYAAVTFFILAVVLAFLQRNFQSRQSSDFEKKLNQPGKTSSGMMIPPTTTTPRVVSSNTVTIPVVIPTNAPTTPVTPATGTNAESAPAGQ